jgi:hypothetical protein
MERWNCYLAEDDSVLSSYWYLTNHITLAVITSRTQEPAGREWSRSRSSLAKSTRSSHKWMFPMCKGLQCGHKVGRKSHWATLRVSLTAYNGCHNICIVSVAATRLKAGSELKPVMCHHQLNHGWSWEKVDQCSHDSTKTATRSRLKPTIMAPRTPPRPGLQVPQSTPFKVTTATTLPFTTMQKYRIKLCSVMASKIWKYLWKNN